MAEINRINPIRFTVPPDDLKKIDSFFEQRFPSEAAKPLSSKLRFLFTEFFFNTCSEISVCITKQKDKEDIACSLLSSSACSAAVIFTQEQQEAYDALRNEYALSRVRMMRLIIVSVLHQEGTPIAIRTMLEELSIQAKKCHCESSIYIPLNCYQKMLAYISEKNISMSDLVGLSIFCAGGPANIQIASREKGKRHPVKIIFRPEIYAKLTGITANMQTYVVSAVTNFFDAKDKE